MDKYSIKRLISYLVQSVIVVVLLSVTKSIVAALVAAAVLAPVMTLFTDRKSPETKIRKPEHLESLKEANALTSAYDEEISPFDIAQLDEIYSHNDEEKLINLIMLEKNDIAKDTVNSFFDALEKVGGGREMASYLATNLIRTYVKIISNIQVTDSGKYKFDNLLKIIKLDEVEQMKKELTDVADSICCEINLSKCNSDETIGERVRNYVEQNYSNHDLDVSKIGDYLNLSPSYATKLFKQETGEVLSNYINSVRVDKAKELLMQGVYRIDRIAKMVGYLDARALTRAFKRLYGLTPSQYKEIASIESDCEQND